MRRALLAGLVLGLGSGGCGPDTDRNIRPHQITFAELADQLEQGATFAEIHVPDVSLEASEVHVHDPDGDEKIVSTIASKNAGTGLLTLHLGGLLVTYDDDSRFRLADGTVTSRETWEGTIETGTAVELRRDVPPIAQSPDDASFFAVDLRIATAMEEHKLEVLLDKDNLTVESDSEGTLHVLGLDIEVNADTSLHDDDELGGTPDASGAEFEGTVTAVDVLDGTLTLADGLVVDVKGATFDPQGDLFSLAAIGEALMADQPVRAEGLGEIATDGLMVATVVKVEVDD